MERQQTSMGGGAVAGVEVEEVVGLSRTASQTTLLRSREQTHQKKE